ncbi:MAG: hypothetical protein A2Y41_01635 [Spirochaetes bacterium GWB1_36_13]|nr:MAG: hypothetical protein A2Y41_01635 [Spirochaetes bacterium GWB1_36_13]
MSIGSIFGVLLSLNALIFTVVNIHMDIKHKNKAKEETVFYQKKDNALETIEKTKILYLLDDEVYQKRVTKTISLTKEVPVFYKVLMDKSRILEEKPSPMPVWVVSLKKPDKRFLYFIGTRTLAEDQKTALDDAYAFAKEELLSFIGVKMDYEMHLEKTVENKEEVHESLFVDIEKEVLKNIENLDTILLKKDSYYRKIKETEEKSFYEAHVLLSADIEKLKKAVQESVRKIVEKMEKDQSMLKDEKKIKKSLYQTIGKKLDQILSMTEEELEAFQNKRNRYEVLEQTATLSDPVYEVFLCEKLFFLNQKSTAFNHCKKAYEHYLPEMKNLEYLENLEETLSDPFSKRVVKRLSKASFYKEKQLADKAYRYQFFALQLLLLHYDEAVRQNLWMPYFTQIEDNLKLWGKIDALTGFQSIQSSKDGKILFTRPDPKGQIQVLFDKKENPIYSLLLYPTGTVYSYYFKDKIIYKKTILKNKDEKKQFAVYDENNQFLKVIE